MTSFARWERRGLQRGNELMIFHINEIENRKESDGNYRSVLREMSLRYLLVAVRGMLKSRGELVER